MTTTPPSDWDDTILPFQLDRSSIRGRVIRLDGALQQILSRHDYPEPVAALVAEVALLAALIGPTIKLRWKLSLQVQGKGAVRTIAADYYAPTKPGAPGHVRAWANFNADRLDDRPAFDQIGEGYFAVMIDQGDGNLPYQGITPLEGGRLASCAEAYFAQSEQLPTRFELGYGQSRNPGGEEHWRAGGIMLQTLPASATEAAEPADQMRTLEAADILQGAESEDWNRANVLLDTVELLELVGPNVSPTKLLERLFHEEEPRIFDVQPVKFGCPCNPDRVRNTLSIYSAKDIEVMTTEDGVVTADCQFCGAHYALDPKSLGFEAEVDAEGSPIAGQGA